MEDHNISVPEPSLMSKKFIAYMLTVPMLISFLMAQIYVDYQLVLEEKEPLFSEGFMTLQLYIIGALVIVYIGGQAALDAVLGWVRGGGANKTPQFVMMPPASPERDKRKMRPRSLEERGVVQLEVDPPTAQ